MQKSESEIERQLIDGVKKLGGKAYKFVSPGNKGVPDRLILLPGGQVIFCELKKAGEKLKAHQQKRREELESLGAVVKTLAGDIEVSKFLAWCRYGEKNDL